MQALNDALGPRLRVAGEAALLEDFSGFFQERDLVSGTQVRPFFPHACSTQLLWRGPTCGAEGQKPKGTFSHPGTLREPV